MAWIVSDETFEELRKWASKGDGKDVPKVVTALVGEAVRVLANLVWTTEDWKDQIDLWQTREDTELTAEQRTEVLGNLAEEWEDFEHEYVTEQVNEHLYDIVDEVMETLFDLKEEAV